MNLKQIQAVEFIISRMNHGKRLVVEYNGKLLSADFLAYFKQSEDSIYALVNDDNKYAVLEDSSSDMFYAHTSLYNYKYSDAFDGTFVRLGGHQYKLSNNESVNFQTLKDVLAHVKQSSKKLEYTQGKEVNITPRNVEFIGTNKVLPFYLFPKDAEFTPVSILDRELVFD